MRRIFIMPIWPRGPGIARMPPMPGWPPMPIILRWGMAWPIGHSPQQSQPPMPIGAGGAMRALAPFLAAAAFLAFAAFIAAAFFFSTRTSTFFCLACGAQEPPSQSSPSVMTMTS